MPATVPAHPAAVLPLKLRWPRHFDGVALVVGSTAPDLRYPAAGIVPLPGTHNWPALLWWCLPVTVLLAWLVRWTAPCVAVQLTSKWCALADYGVLGEVRHPWYVVVWSALLGAASHLVWDSFTHPAVVRDIPALGTPLLGVPLWHWLQWASTIVGSLVTVALLVWISQHRLIRAWHGPAPERTRSGRRFWWPTLLLCGGYLLAAPMLPDLSAPHVQVTRMLVLLCAGLLAGAALDRRGSQDRSLSHPG